MIATKLFIPPLRPKAVGRPRLLERLNGGLHGKLTLLSAPAGFGKTTLLSEWIGTCGASVAWLSLDEGDSDLTRFVSYIVASLQSVVPDIGKGIERLLQSPQSPPVEEVLGALVNEIASLSGPLVLILDDYHLADAEPIDHSLTFLLEHLPSNIHLVIATREDPRLPLSRLRARGQLNELRAHDLRFSPDEVAEFLNGVMGLNLAAEDIRLLETRTEGWIAGLQLAALSLQHQVDTAGFIKSFTGSHRFILDYLVEEVLQQQPERIQTFLLHSSILNRLCGPLCDAVTGKSGAQATLEALERSNLFVVPLDHRREWYRYHHLFAELLMQRLHQGKASSSGEDESINMTTLHTRASRWFEDNALELEAFHHAVAADDIGRAVRLAEGKGMPLLFRGAVMPVLTWLKSLPEDVLNTYPSLWVMYASALLFVNQTIGVEEKLQAAEAALEGMELNSETRNLLGHIASIRATLAIAHHQIETIISQSHRALELLHPDNLPVRTATAWTLGFAYGLQGDRAAAREAYTEAIAKSEAIGHIIITIVATLGLAHLQELDTQLSLAAKTYRGVLEVAGNPPWPLAAEAHLGLARIFYEWNDLDAAWVQGQQALELSHQLQNVDTFASCQILFARLHLARGDMAEAFACLAEAERFAYMRHFEHLLSTIAHTQVRLLLQQGEGAAAARLAQGYDLPTSQARVHLAQGDPTAVLTLLEPLGQGAEAKGWADTKLEVTLLQAVAHHAASEKDEALRRLGEALELAQPGGYIRHFVDEGLPMAQLLKEGAARGMGPGYVRTLLAAFEADAKAADSLPTRTTSNGSLLEPLSERELEVLQLIAEGLSNRAIGVRLFRALDTIKGHNRSIYAKLQAKNRTEAIARARALGLL